MDIANEVRNLRDEMGMNRKEFCEYYSIPYRTMVYCLSDGRRIYECQGKRSFKYAIGSDTYAGRSMEVFVF